jgi:hypothetical protein
MSASKSAAHVAASKSAAHMAASKSAATTTTVAAAAATTTAAATSQSVGRDGGGAQRDGSDEDNCSVQLDALHRDLLSFDYSDFDSDIDCVWSA